MYSLDILLSQFGTSLLFHVQFCYFLTCIQISQEAGKVVWYSHLFQNFPQFIVIHTVKRLDIVNKAEVDVFLELFFFLMIHQILAIWSLVTLLFLNPTWTSISSQFMYHWSLAWRILSITLLACEMWRRKWQPTPVFLAGESQGRGSLVGCHLWGRTESDTTEAT